MESAIILCRESTTKKENSNLKKQELSWRTFCADNSIDIIWIYYEKDSWIIWDRPILDKAIKHAIDNKVNYFIVYELDRLSKSSLKTKEIYDNLRENNIELKESKNKKIYKENNIINSNIYNWNIWDNSEYMNSICEQCILNNHNTLLSRTINKKIQLERIWYQTRKSNFWYYNKKIRTEFGRAVIQLEHPIKWKWIKYMFNKKANSNLSEKEIVDNLNNKWFISKNKKKLTVKQLKNYIKNPIYAWYLASKWTWYKFIKTPYKGLISINTWDKANQWKIQLSKIIEKKE